MRRSGWSAASFLAGLLVVAEGVVLDGAVADGVTDGVVADGVALLVAGGVLVALVSSAWARGASRPAPSASPAVIAPARREKPNVVKVVFPHRR
ncbi:hypothetical protein GCM10010452_16030 [Crossiella cryophila]